jgi:hypothetical protein
MRSITGSDREHLPELLSSRLDGSPTPLRLDDGRRRAFDPAPQALLDALVRVRPAESRALGAAPRPEYSPLGRFRKPLLYPLSYGATLSLDLLASLGLLGLELGELVPGRLPFLAGSNPVFRLFISL